MSAPIVPALAVPPRTIQITPPSPRTTRVLPLPQLASRHESRTVYGLATMDRHGRLAGRDLLRALGWTAGQALHIRIVDGLILIDPGNRGPDRVTNQGHVRLPDRIRRRST